MRNELSQAQGLLEMAVQTAQNFFLEDVGFVKSVLSGMIANAFYSVGHFSFSGVFIIGMTLMIIGSVGLVMYSLQVLHHAFEERAGWGIALMTNILYPLGPHLGGIWVPLMILPSILDLLFLLFCWRAARQAIVMQLFSLNLFVVGAIVSSYAP